MQPGNHPVEILPKRLYWVSDRSPPVIKGKTHTFCIDHELNYIPYASDFGPLDLGSIFRFCTLLDNILADPKLEKFIINHYTCLIPAKRANAAFLMAAYQMIKLQKTAEESWESFETVSRFIPFRDASTEGSSFELSIIDCLKGLEKAMSLGWFSLDTFNLASYQKLSSVENGGLNWIIPDKILASVAPSDKKTLKDVCVDEYVEIFKSLGVSLVIQLNAEKYNSDKFIENGINHMNLYFHDGSVPESNIIDEFLQAVENATEAVAVHCKAGLGRTGTLIGCYVIKTCGFTAPEFIGWARLCRPGSVLGPQQFFLCDYEESLKSKGRNSDIGRAHSPVITGRGEMTLFEKYRAKFGEMGQADKLVQLMKSAPSSPTNNVRAPRINLLRDFGKLRIPGNK